MNVLYLAEVDPVCFTSDSNHIRRACEEDEGLVEVLRIVSDLANCISSGVDRYEDGLHNSGNLLIR
jgi:hypothetical protein